MSAPARLVVLLAAGTLLVPGALHAGCNEGETMSDGMVCHGGAWTMPEASSTGGAPVDAVLRPTSVLTPSSKEGSNTGANPLNRDGQPPRSFSALMKGNEMYSALAAKEWKGANGGLLHGVFHPGAQELPGGNIMAPTAPCASNPAEKCFPPEQLDAIYKAIVSHEGPNGEKRWDDLAPLAERVLHHPEKANDVSPRDLVAILHYLNREQRGIDTVEEMTGLKWEDFSKNPAALDGILAGLKPDQAKVVDGIREDLRSEMAQLISEQNNFHPPLMDAHDTISERIMDKLKTKPEDPPIMTGGEYVAGDPRNPNAYSYAADEALRNGDAQQAASLAGKALQLDDQNQKALSTLAAANYDLKNMDAAAQAANKALELNPNDAQAQTVAQLAHGLVAGDAKVPSSSSQRHDFADVPSGLSGANAPWHELSVSDANERAAVAAARDAERALNRGDLSAAKAAADRALAADPHSAYAYGLKAFAEIKGGDAEGALRDAVAGLALNPADKMAQKARAQALLKLGRYPEGLLAANAAVAGDPRSAFARYLQAEARAASGDLAGAREALKAAAELDLRYSEMYKASLQVADNGDMAFLFPDLKPGALAAANAAAAPAASTRNARFLKVAGGAAAGGGLLAWLLWQLFGASLAPALKTIFTRRGPRVADPSTVAEAPSLEPHPAKDPSLLRGQYKTLRQIGVGGMGMVYEGTDVSLGRRVAIKKMREELRLDRRQRERFVSEAKTVAALHHPNVVDIYAIVDESDELYLIFEYVAGKTIHEMVHGRGPLPFDEARRLYRGVCEGLEYAHARGVIHRDLKPSNIMITDEGRPKVMDFGIARAAKDAMTRYSMTNTVVGTPPYMAPEQEQGVVRKESDVFALAVCLYETVTGALPFAGTGGGMMMNKINKAFVPASRVVAGLPEGLDEVFDKAFEPDPDKRYRTVGELRSALDALAVSTAV